MKLEIFEYIEIWYNIKSRHSALNYATIEEFNNQINYKNVAQFNVQFLFAYPAFVWYRKGHFVNEMLHDGAVNPDRAYPNFAKFARSGFRKDFYLLL